MARAKEKDENETTETSESEALDGLTGDEREILSALVELDTQNDVRWKVTRKGARDIEENGYCGTLSTAELTMDTMAERFGPGLYSVKGNRENGTYVKHATIRISKSAKRREEPGASVKTVATSVQEQIELMKAERAEERKERNQLMLQIAGIAAPIVAALVAKPAPPVPSLGELGTLITALRPPEPKQESSLDQLSKLASIAKQLGGGEGGGGSETTTMDLIGKGLDALPALISGVRGGTASSAIEEPPTSLSSRTLPNPQTRAPIRVDIQRPSAETESGNMLMQLLPFIRQNLTYLIQQASRDKDPNLYAEWLVDQLPDNVEPDQIKAFLSRSDWFTLLQQFDTRVAQYQPWFTQLRDEALSLDWGLEEPPYQPPQGATLDDETSEGA